MVDDQSRTEMLIRRLPNGGYVVRDVPLSQQYVSLDLFASSDIEDALVFIRSKLATSDERQNHGQ